MVDLKSLVSRHMDKTYVIQFDPGSEEAGTYLVMLHGPGVGLAGGVFLVKHSVVQILEKEGLAFRKEKVTNPDVENLKRELSAKGWRLASV